ncbi:MAG: type III-A CRISPR-associated protein Csm2 [Proteobacteria bacterium]|nr:type III-A CRISPR-associated protein Csm2 [Pseudomonadota bacterium]
MQYDFDKNKTPKLNQDRPYQGNSSYKEFNLRLDEAVREGDASEIIAVAKEIAKDLANPPRPARPVEASQMRKFLDEIVKIHQQINLEIPKDQPLRDGNNLRNKLAILRPRFAYTVTRKNNDKLKTFYLEVLDKWLERVPTFKQIDLEYLHLFVESLIAYHKVNAKP